MIKFNREESIGCGRKLDAARRIDFKLFFNPYNCLLCYCYQLRGYISHKSTTWICINYVFLLGGWFRLVPEIEDFGLQSGQAIVLRFRGDVKTKSLLLLRRLRCNAHCSVSFLDSLRIFPREKLIFVVL